jgi:hypothetical protein
MKEAQSRSQSRVGLSPVVVAASLTVDSIRGSANVTREVNEVLRTGLTGLGPASPDGTSSLRHHDRQADE